MSKKIDHLTSDPIIEDQKWVCLSFLTPELVKYDKKCDVRSVKVRGCYATEEEAKRRCEELQTYDGLHNVYIAPVGKWLPWCDDPEKANDFEYSENELNKLMKAYKKNQDSAKMMHEQRKNDMINKNKEDNEQVSTYLNDDKKKEVSSDLIDDDEQDYNYDDLKNNLDEESNNLNGIKDELEEAEKLYKKMLEKQSEQNI